MTCPHKPYQFENKEVKKQLLHRTRHNANLIQAIAQVARWSLSLNLTSMVLPSVTIRFVIVF